MEVKGLNNLFAALDKKLEDITRQGEANLEKAGEHGVEVAKSRARVRTGNMRGKIYAERKGLRVSIISPVDYSIHNEFETRGRPAQPFVRPAGEETAKELLDLTKKSLS
jgi:HK97 gp10 family phage protein